MDHLLKKSVAVPKSRLSRLSRVGTLAGRVAGNMIIDGSKDLVKGRKPEVKRLLLTEQNLTHLADQLATMRGAAMKAGQLLSMDAGNLMPKELSVVLDRLRSHAFTMPAVQLHDVLERGWGADWIDQFQRFSFEPIAAASIGQVHRALTLDGHDLAVKIQYPGVRDSIDSDLDNVQGLLRMSGLIPKDMDVTPLFDEARTQLKFEADYLREGEQIKKYHQLLGRFDRQGEIAIPDFYESISTTELLCMSYMPGATLDHLERMNQQERDRIVSLLFELFFFEFLEEQTVQTDPNLANFLYDEASGKLVLLDFGATRDFSDSFVDSYKSALMAAFHQDRSGLQTSLETLGFFKTGRQVKNLNFILDIFIMATEPMRYEGNYNFGSTDLARRIHEKGMQISSDPDAWHTPPPDVLFLHRKMAGLYLIASRLEASVNVNEQVLRYFR